MSIKSETKLTLYHEASSGGFKQWTIWIENDETTITVEYGKVGCKLQTSSDPTKPKGKPGTKSYMNEKDCALFNYGRQIRKKREEGYRESMDAQAVQDIFTGLTKRFVPAKPRNDVEVPELLRLAADGKVWAQRKRNGQRHLVLITTKGDVRIYSRRLDDMTGHFPQLCGFIKKLGLPRRTILDGEILVQRPDGTDDFKAVSTITRSKPEKGALREAALIDSLRYMVFDCLFFAGKAVWEKPYDYRYHEVLHNCCHLPIGDPWIVHVVPVLEDNLQALMDHAKAQRWEGLVCWLWEDPTVVRDGGKPKRAGCIKWKVKIDYDVIATGYFLGSGKRSEVVGGFNIAEYDENGDLRSCGKCGSGLDMETAEDALTWEYPLVIKIESDGQEPTGKFIFPVYITRHEDKLPEEVVGQDLAELE